MLGRRFVENAQNDCIKQCRAGTLDTAVVSVKSGKNGRNLQGMNWMATAGYISQYTEEEQAQGIAPLQRMLITGRCCRVGQKKPTRFYVLWVEGQGLRTRCHAMPINCAWLKLRHTRMEPKRLLKKRARKVGDDEDYEECSMDIVRNPNTSSFWISVHWRRGQESCSIWAN